MPARRKRQASQEAPEVRLHRPLRLVTPRHLDGGAPRQGCPGCSNGAGRTSCSTPPRSTGGARGAWSAAQRPVSYTHLTLPTICSV
eukprot:8489838-Alexandrium_andersonii.AAC.1